MGDSRCHRVVQEDVHSPPMDFRNSVSPRFDIAKMTVKKGRIECRVSIGTPGLIDQDCSREIDTLKNQLLSVHVDSKC